MYDYYTAPEGKVYRHKTQNFTTRKLAVKKGRDITADYELIDEEV